VSSRMLAALLLLAPLAAGAAACRFQAGAGLAFGTYEILSPAPRDTQATVSVVCEGTGTAQTLSLMLRVGPGMNAASANVRRMRNTGASGATLAYGLYRDSARSSVWGTSTGIDTMGATLAVPASGSASASFILYGRIPPGQDAHVGTYGDAVQVTIDY
jgi:spore coat protein U-like protein